MIGWHHGLNGHELEQLLGDGERQGSLECCSPWGDKESDMTWQLKNNNYTYTRTHTHIYVYMRVQSLVGKIPWRKTWQPTLVFLHGESHGQRSLPRYSPQVGKELDMTEVTQHAWRGKNNSRVKKNKDGTSYGANTRQTKTQVNIKILKIVKCKVNNSKNFFKGYL